MLSARPRIDEMSARRCADMSTIRALSLSHHKPFKLRTQRSIYNAYISIEFYRFVRNEDFSIIIVVRYKFLRLILSRMILDV